MLQKYFFIKKNKAGIFTNFLYYFFNNKNKKNFENFDKI